jgi:CBS domain-containing protein
MRLTEVLHPEHVVAPLSAETIRQAVLGLVHSLVESGAVAHPEKLERLTAEERIRDTIHIGDRVLLPHMRTDAVERMVIAMGITPEPLRLAPGTAEGTAQVVVLVLAPPSAADLYLQTVAALARVLRSDAVVDQLLAARSAEEVIAVPEMRDLVVQPRLTVRDIMTQRVYRVSPDTPVRELMDLMTRHNLNAVPVVGAKREVLGMVTERDLLRHLLPSILRAGGGEQREDGGAPGQHAGEMLVRDIMSRSVMCIPEDQALAEVASIMINKDVERLPVVSEGRLTGFMTRSDIIRKLFSQ